VNLPVPDTYVPDYAAADAVTRETLDRSAGEGVRRYLDDLLGALADLHRSGASGRNVNEAHSDGVDRLLRRLAQLAEERYYADGGDLGDRLSIVAVGGYGRREMSIRSDVDLLFVHRGELTPLAANIAERIQYWLWDAGIVVGGAVRNVEETLALAREDNSVATGLLGARFLGGDPAPLHQLGVGVRANLQDHAAEFVADQVRGLEDRHTKFGESLYLLQPNLKDGWGGLRDYHTAYWVACAAHPSVGTIDDLLYVGVLSESEMRSYEAALEFVWRLRNELHLLLGRKADQMSFEHQEQIATGRGYRDEGPALAVEQFMGDFYRCARTIGTLSEIVIEQCVAHTRPPAPPPPVRVVEDGFRVVGDHLEIPHSTHLRQEPLRLLSAFRVAQRHRVALSRTARRLVTENLDVVDERLQRDPKATAVFLGILGSEFRVMRTLMEMNEVGLLGAYLPEWEHLVCRWQHVMYHTYTVDVHSIFLVEELRRLWRGKYEEEHPELTQLVREADREVIFLGCLLHDIGKGFGGDHSSKGAVRAVRCLERLGLPQERVDRIIFLVRQHLWMSHVAQRRDLSDPRVIVEFASVVEDRENLRNLYLVTFADIRASSKAGWTEWKGQLLRELYERTAEYLEADGEDLDVALELVDARVRARQDGARSELLALGVAPEAVDGYFDGMPRRYFIAHTPPQIARHAAVVLSYDPERLLATAVREMRGGFSEFIICTSDVHGLYATIAGSLTAASVNILGSNVYTTKSGLALEIYRVTTPAGGPDERAIAWGRHEEILRAVLSGERELASFLTSRRRPLGSAAPASREPARVLVTNDESEFYTVVDVTANDRIGLLYGLVGAITGQDLEIYVSKASTILDQVADTFYLKDAKRRKIADPATLEELRKALQAVADGNPDG
jgi:[protein-PII] uridylyltransferase